MVLKTVYRCKFVIWVNQSFNFLLYLRAVNTHVLKYLILL